MVVSQDLIGQKGILQTVFHVGRLAEFMHCSELLLGYINELISDQELIEIIEKSVAPIDSWKSKSFDSIFDLRLFRIVLYALVRATSPLVAVETGVLHGLTTIFILRALERNGRGRLVSVDLPSYAEFGPANKDGYKGVLPIGKEPGWIIPGNRFPNWELKRGPSRAILQNTTREQEIDFFCHDSEHTFDTVWFELNWAWDHLRPGGVLVCDNVESSVAFFDFARRVQRAELVFPGPDASALEAPRFGVMFK